MTNVMVKYMLLKPKVKCIYLNLHYENNAITINI